TQQSVLLNESAVRSLGWEQGANRTVLMGGQRRTVVGVVEDFNFASLRHQIEPVVLLRQERGHRMLSIRIDRTQAVLALDGIRAAWEQVNSDYPFEYSFFTEEYNKLMRDDAAFSALLNQFTFIAILIACMGLYGLASFTAERKTREISIRKVMGAGPGHILSLILLEYGVLILIANMLAWTAAYVFVDNWLSAFAYRIDLSWSSFLLASSVTTLLALATVSGEVGSVVRSKPAYALRSE
ncbi:MAG: ABC transporter permease, partial [Burkholderiales bacterium]